MAEQPFVTLNDGRAIPQLGLGVWQTADDKTAEIVRIAVEAGWRHIDTAAMYHNEQGVGEGVRTAAAPREDIFVTTKVWNDDQGYDATLAAFDQSLARLGLDYVDLYLIHWPSPRRALYWESWKALVRLQEDGRARSIGVANFSADQIDRIIAETGVAPALNQIELHPYFQQRPLRAADADRGVATESWSPLGHGRLLGDPAIGRIAARHGRTPAQVIIRWHIENGLIVIPKTATPSRIRENFDVFGFALDTGDLTAIDALDDPNGRTGPDPMTAGF